MSDNVLVRPRITYLSGKEVTLGECRTVLNMKLLLSELHSWMPCETMVLVNGKILGDNDHAPETSYVLWKEKEFEQDDEDMDEDSLASIPADEPFINDLETLARFGHHDGAKQTAIILREWSYENFVANFHV